MLSRAELLQNFGKRTLDIIGSSIALLISAPLMVLIALVTIAETGWPVLYTQTRIGRSFRPFRLFKFRSMKTASSGALITVRGDKRITRVGRLIRATKLDELPQLWNILKGDMSLVGPRPEVSVYVEMFRNRYGRLLHFRPGLTDYASIRFRNEEKLLAATDDPMDLYVKRILPQKLDLADEYVQGWTLSRDLSILLRTGFVLLNIDFRRGATISGRKIK